MNPQAGNAPAVEDGLTVAVRRLVESARGKALDDAARSHLDDALSRLSQPLRLAIAGRVKAGKSTLLNALVGEELAPTDAGECTKIVTWYIGSDVARVTSHLRNGDVRTLRYSRVGGALEVDPGPDTEAIDHLEVRWPSSRLRHLTLIDTPGIASLSTEVSQRASVLLATDDEQPSVADAVLYLLRHTHASDVRFLEAFHDDEAVRGTSVNAVGVLSRADEIGAARLDALDVAARVADRYQHHRQLRQLCPLVIPVSGLLGQGGTTLREEEYRALARIAMTPETESAELLLTADRMTRDDPTLALTQIERRHLLDRFGLFGVRLATTLIRRGDIGSATQLAAELTSRSGLDELRGVLLRQFTERSQLLRARSAMSTVRAVVRRGGCADAAVVEASIEEIKSSAHEFVEVRLLTDLRSGAIDVPERLVEEMDRVLGGSGHGATERLALTVESAPDDVRAAALDALGRWQRVAESPLSNRSVKVAARVVTRTLEGLLARPAA